MLWIAVLSTVLLYAGWGYLLYRLHARLAIIAPELSRQIGRPSLFWTPFDGDARLVRLIRRRDLGGTRYASLEGQIRIMRVWAIATIGATVWMLWVCTNVPSSPSGI